ncbi:hypothetical protein A5664_14735 [Mycolicibacterium fortuitum]|uniref:hypothetical protein n=1 Tax=Mycolicibacterium fortuitum TaxID=1766 RepID=UPI0007EDE8CD|nr:hypothetical protein [Mycolicibacterium fortuitum]OBI66152.1 hypothetical protein A5664_14735 [Mycolicibacterium fortuitum]OBJ97701.1 hypothetical protein A5638_12345 [Mycolicibacterium fortuitum]
MRVARVTGHVNWWVFVVARLMSELGLTMGGQMPRRYADYAGDSIFGTGLGVRGDYGWTAYTPLTDGPPTGLSDPFFETNVLSTISIVALAVTTIAAVVEAVLARRWLSGAGTVLAPVIGAAIILTALHERSGYLGGGRLELPLFVVFVLVLLGVAVREVWSRVLEPRLAPDRGA